MPAWVETPGGLAIAVRVTPRGGRDVLMAGDADRFAARLAAAPVDGMANAALLALVAKTFGVARRDVTLIGGRTGRVKRIAIAGAPAMLAQTAASLYAAVA